MGSNVDTNSRNRYYTIEYLEDGVYLTVKKPTGNKNQVDEVSILDEFRRKKIKKFNAAAISDTVKNASGVAVKIAEPQEEEAIDAAISVFASPEKMKAYINIEPPEGKGNPASMKDIITKLKEEGIIYGIKEDIIKTLAEYPVYEKSICIAEGTESTNGKNGQIKYLVNIDKNIKPTINEDVRENIRDINIIEKVKAGEKLVELIPPKKGVSGKNVLGNEIKALDGKPAKLLKGRNVKEDDEKTGLISLIDGQLDVHEGKISVFATYEVHANVDNSTGNIKFIGNVCVRGNVLSGFTIEAGGSVEVQGIVEAATIIAEGDIILRRGMHGSGKGLLRSQGDIIAKYIESSIIEAKHDIKSEAIMHSDVKCGNLLELGGKKGLLVGGTIRVGKEIKANVIGSHLATATNIEVGVDPGKRDRYKFLKKEVIIVEENFKKSEQAMAILKKMESAGLLTDDKREMLAKTFRSKLIYQNQKEEYTKEIAELEELLQSEAQGLIKVDGEIYYGVKVSIGSCMMYIKDTLKHCTLYRDSADVRVGPY